MLHYELLYILPGTLSENEVPAQIETVKEVITKAGGVDVTITPQGKNRLAYPMKHIRYGYFQLGYFQAKPTDVPEIEAKLKLVDGMLRLIIRSFEQKKKPLTTILFSGMSNSPAAMREEAAEEQAPVRDVAPSVPVEAPADVPTVPEKKKRTTKKAAEPKAQEVSLDDINKKLDQLLENDIANV